MRRRVMIWLLIVSVVAFITYLCVPFSLVGIDEGGMNIVVKWIDTPYNERNSFFDYIAEKMLSAEARAFRAVVHNYSPEHWEVEYSRDGLVSLYSVLGHDRRYRDASGVTWVWVSLYTGQILSHPAEFKECYAWNGTATAYCKVTARTRSTTNQISVRRRTRDDWRDSDLGVDDVFVIFDKRGLFVRRPGSLVFCGYKWKTSVAQ